MTKRQMLEDYMKTLSRMLNGHSMIGYLFYEIRQLVGVDCREECTAIHDALESCWAKLEKALDETES